MFALLLCIPRLLIVLHLAGPLPRNCLQAAHTAEQKAGEMTVLLSCHEMCSSITLNNGAMLFLQWLGAYKRD